MPGILPMKIIKCGNALQSRIAQACDRCRAKKIRCDGASPCKHCAEVNFECKTSDKLSRRAFPRNYTENLEEQVKQLQAQVRELEGLLDEKEESLDFMYKVQSGASAHSRSVRQLSAGFQSGISNVKAEASNEEECLSVRRVVPISPSRSQQQQCASNSNTQSLLYGYIKHMSGPQSPSVAVDVPAVYDQPDRHQRTHRIQRATTCDPSSLGRATADRLMHIFFQEVSPLFPVLDHQKMLACYDSFFTSKTKQQDSVAVAQLWLVLSIAAISMQDPLDEHLLSMMETEWTSRMQIFTHEVSLGNIQCLSLASLYHLKQRQHSHMFRYLTHAVALSRMLGLQCDQGPWEEEPILVEDRKRIFWTLLTIDSFAAAHAGLSPLIDLNDVECQFPNDTACEQSPDPAIETSTQGGFSTFAGAIALFKLAKLLSRVLRELYPTKASYLVSLKAISSLECELKEWSASLPSPLKLQFEQGKPSTRTIADRSPFLSLAYQYVHTLILKPSVLAEASVSENYMSSLFNLAAACKKSIQILDLLEERKMSFAFCIDRDDILVQAAVGMLWQCSQLDIQSKMVKESLKVARHACDKLIRDRQDARAQLTRLCDLYVVHKTAANSDVHGTQLNTKTRHKGISSSAIGALRATDSQWSGTRVTSQIYFTPRTSDASADTSPAERYPFSSSCFARSESSLPIDHRQSQSTKRLHQSKRTLRNTAFETDSHPALSIPSNDNLRDWQSILSNIDGGMGNIHDGIYGGQSSNYFGNRTESSKQKMFPNASTYNLADSSIQPMCCHQSNYGLPDTFTPVDLGARGIALSQSSGESPLLDGYVDTAYSTMLNESPSSSNDSFDIMWDPLLDPLHFGT